MADEGDFIELLVANERIGKWIDILTASPTPERQKHALKQLMLAAESKATYAEEARRAGAVQLMTKLLAKGDDEVLDMASRIIAACSGPMACGGKMSEFSYDGLALKIKEGALGDGLGAKVWMVAHVLCRELCDHPEIVRGKQVVEIGSGCGVCGILAAKLGAGNVVLSDVEGPVLRNLRDCVHLNAQDSAGPSETQSTSTSAKQGAAASAAEVAAIPNDDELFDDAESVDDLTLDDFLGGEPEERPRQQQLQQGANAASGSSSGGSSSWDAGNMSVRLLDWQESVDLMAGQQGEGRPAATAGSSSSAASGSRQARVEGEMPPAVPLDVRYEAIIGTEVMYEVQHAVMVTAVIQHRLAPHGMCLLSCAVRSQAVFDTFAAQCKARGLRYRRHQVALAEGNEGLLGRRDEYEGGFLLMAVDHAAAPYQHWHRDDFEDV